MLPRSDTGLRGPIAMVVACMGLGALVYLNYQPFYETMFEANIFRAVRADDPEAIKQALREDPRINKESSIGESPLAYAVRTGRVNAVKYLLKRKANVDGKDGYTPMHIAGQYGRAEIAQVLIAHGLDSNDVWAQDGHDPLIRACHGMTPRFTDAAHVFMTHGATPGAIFECFRETPNPVTKRVAREELFKRDGIKRDEQGRGIL